ncbi:unnamed protein product, partial [Mesorhabditis spiculigera]
MKKVAENLAHQANEADVLVIWTDCDLEGEHIAWQIKNICLNFNPRMKVYRANFFEVTEVEARSALTNLRSLNKNMIEAVNCRYELDLRLSIAFTCLQTKALRKHDPTLFGTGNEDFITFGSCQFPTLGLVVGRVKAIQQFVPKSFWEIKVHHVKDGVKTEFVSDKKRKLDATKAQVLFDAAKQVENASVESATTQITEFLKLAAQQLDIIPSTALGVATRLYDRGLISFPRTAANRFPDSKSDIFLRELVEKFTEDPDSEVGRYAKKILEQPGGPAANDGDKSIGPERPIYPVRYATRGQFLKKDDLGWSVFQLIVRHTLASLSSDARGEETKVTIRLGGESFTATSLQIEEPGYLEICPYDKPIEKSVGKYDHGETITDHQIRMFEPKTEPPPLLTEAALIDQMDENGIGTVYGNHIRSQENSRHSKAIQRRKYVILDENKCLVPTHLGITLIEWYNAIGLPLANPGMRAHLKKEIMKIAAGTKTKDQVLKEQLAAYRRWLGIAEQNTDRLIAIFERNYKASADPCYSYQKAV